MNYIVTDKHELLKNGIIIVQNELKGWYNLNVAGIEYSYKKVRIDEWLKDGWIVEQQKPEFTKDDIISICEFTLMYGKQTCNVKREANEVIDNWLSKRNESNKKH